MTNINCNSHICIKSLSTFIEQKTACWFTLNKIENWVPNCIFSFFLLTDIHTKVEDSVNLPVFVTTVNQTISQTPSSSCPLSGLYSTVSEKCWPDNIKYVIMPHKKESSLLRPVRQLKTKDIRCIQNLL
jgi:hypothetical protein